MPRLAGYSAARVSAGTRRRPTGVTPESRSFVFFDKVGLPLPVPQAWIEDEDGYPFARVDACGVTAAWGASATGQ
jgi:hypothetical protein